MRYELIVDVDGDNKLRSISDLKPSRVTLTLVRIEDTLPILTTLGTKELVIP